MASANIAALEQALKSNEGLCHRFYAAATPAEAAKLAREAGIHVTEEELNEWAGGNGGLSDAHLEKATGGMGSVVGAFGKRMGDVTVGSSTVPRKAGGDAGDSGGSGGAGGYGGWFQTIKKKLQGG